MANATCAVDDCPKPGPYKRSLCGMHCHRWRTNGDAGPVEPRYRERRPRGTVPCDFPDCDRTAITKGYCNRHYKNLLRHGDPTPPQERPLEVRLREVGWITTEAGCWEWNGERNEEGYGIFNAKHLGYDQARAHRAMYECFAAPIPDGLILRHHCDNPPCVNPDHLIPGTAADNSRDMVERNRHPRHNRNRTECDNGHDLTVPGSTRKRGRETVCLECARERSRRYDERHGRHANRSPVAV